MRSTNGAHLQSLTDVLFRAASAELQSELEAYRVDYVLANKQIDLTRHYTSLWPTPSQQWLFKNKPQEWFNGLPDFVQEFLVAEVDKNIAAGKLDASEPRARTWIEFQRRPDHKFAAEWLEKIMGGLPRSPSDSGLFR